MSTRGHNILEGMGEILLSLAMKHCNSRQWGSWLKVLLMGAAMEGDATMVLSLLKAGAFPSGGRARDDLTPLHAAALGGSVGVIASLLKTSASGDIDKKTKLTGRTPLCLAIKNGHTDVALALVRAGGDVNLTEGSGWSPLMRAAFDGKAELVNDLLLRGARIDAKSKDGDQAMHLAVRRRHLAVIKVLLRSTASPGTRGKNNVSPVESAASHGDTDILLELLSWAPNLDILDDGGRPALLTAVKNGHPKAIDMLVDAGLVLDRKDGAESLLHVACGCLQPASVGALLRRNADEMLLNNADELPGDIVGLDIPEEKRDGEVVADIQKMLERAPADRVWRRRGWLAMLNARKRATDNKDHGEDHEDGARDKQHGEAGSRSVLRSRKKLKSGGRRATADAVGVHPSLKRFHWTVTKMVDVADELIFRKIVSFL